MNQTTENKQTDLLFPFLPASVAVYQGKARMGKKKRTKKAIAKLPYCVYIQILLCRVLIHQLELSAASEKHALIPSESRKLAD